MKGKKFLNLVKKAGLLNNTVMSMPLSDKIISEIEKEQLKKEFMDLVEKQEKLPTSILSTNAWGIKYIHKLNIKKETEKKAVINQFFKKHKTHTQAEGDVEYFDAMFLSLNLNCSCGKILNVTREMIENKKIIEIVKTAPKCLCEICIK